jgi:hypothetical protein
MKTRDVARNCYEALVPTEGAWREMDAQNVSLCRTTSL